MSDEERKPMSLEDAASLLATPPQEDGSEATEAETAEAENAEDTLEATDTEEAQEDASDADEDAEAEEAEDEDADSDGEEIASEDEDGDEDADQEEPAETLYTVKVDGEEMQVSLNDLQRSYSGQAHIQRQMQRAAEARKQAEAQFGALQQQRAALDQLGTELQSVGMTPPQAPDPSTFDQDPVGYMDAKMRYDRDKADYDQRVEKYRQQVQQQNEAMTQAHAAYVADQAEQLKVLIPEFADTESDIQRKITGAAKELYGFTDDELAAVVDHRLVLVLNDARQWRELQATKKTVVKEATKKAKPPLKAKGKRRVDPKREARKRNRANLKKSGSIDDAVSLIYDG